MQVSHWESLRLGKFTSSQIHKLLGNGKHGYMFSQTALTYIKERAAEILTGETEHVSSKAMEWGTFHEPAAISAYINKYGEVKYYGVENPEFFEYTEFSGGSPDAVSETHLIEIKCPYKSVNHLENIILTDEAFKLIHPEYYAQIQFNMFLTNRECAHFVSFDPRMACQEQQLVVIEISADKEFQDHILSRIEAAEKELTNLLKLIINHE